MPRTARRRYYFQPHVLRLAMLELAGLDPGVAFNFFGLGALAFAATTASLLYEKLVGWQTMAQKLGLVCLFWGGGVLSLAGPARPKGKPVLRPR